MKTTNEIKVAGKLTIKDWEDLEKVLKNELDENWGLAFHFFEERIRTRYINPINAILDMDLKMGEGFAVVNLQCSLIETIESFINGWKYKNIPNSKGWFKGESPNEIKVSITDNGKIFKSFFENRIFFKDLGIDGIDFYKSVRCGLLHETQTKNGWKIKANGSGKSIEGKIIYRDIFQNNIEEVIKNYKDSIVVNNYDTSVELRKNFIEKFNYICELSKEN